jgi:2-polyprenyl-6-methoxyphenol hydroxylase-like FAD-dependent oxidoreductase
MQGGYGAGSIDSKLVVAADGVQSVVRGAFGVDAEVRDYGQTAVITTVLPQRFHEHVAYERFTDSGPLALLPLDGGRCTLVLTLSIMPRRRPPWAGLTPSFSPKCSAASAFAWDVS